MTETGVAGRMLIVIGAVLIAAGTLFVIAGKLPWLGRLPGDILIRKGQTTFFFPITTSLIVSIVLSLLLFVVSRR